MTIDFRLADTSKYKLPDYLEWHAEEYSIAIKATFGNLHNDNYVSRIGGWNFTNLYEYSGIFYFWIWPFENVDHEGIVEVKGSVDEAIQARYTTAILSGVLDV